MTHDNTNQLIALRLKPVTEVMTILSLDEVFRKMVLPSFTPNREKA